MTHGSKSFKPFLLAFSCTCKTRGGSLTTMASCIGKSLLSEFGILIDASIFRCEPYFGTVSKLISRASTKYLLVKKNWRNLFTLSPPNFLHLSHMIEK